jgi:hypothetical protein
MIWGYEYHMIHLTPWESYYTMFWEAVQICNREEEKVSQGTPSTSPRTIAGRFGYQQTRIPNRPSHWLQRKSVPETQLGVWWLSVSQPWNSDQRTALISS